MLNDGATLMSPEQVWPGWVWTSHMATCDDLMQYIFPGEERPEPAGVSLSPTLAWGGCREKLALTLEHSLSSQSPRLLAIFLTGKFSKSPET